MSEGTAILKLQVQGAQEVLNQLQALHSQLNGMSGQQGPSGMPAGSASPPVQSGGAVVAQTALPPAPGTPPTALSQAAATAGSPMAAAFATWGPNGAQALSYDPTNGHYFDPMTGAYYLGGAAPGIGGKPGGGPSGPQGSVGWKDVGAALGGQYAYSQSMAIMGQFAGGYSQAQVMGRPYHAESLLPAAGSLAFTAIGAGIGFAAGGPIGAGIGAGVGAGIGGIYSNAIEPIVKRDISNADMRALMADGYGFETRVSYGHTKESAFRQFRLGKLTQPEIDLETNWLMAGTPLPIYGFHRSRGLKNPMFREAFDKSIHEALYSPGYIERNGGVLPSLGDSWSDQDEYQMLLDTAWKHPENAVILRNKGQKGLADIASKRAALGITLEDQMAGDQAGISYFGFRAGLSVRYGGSEAGFDDSANEKKAMLSLAQHKREQARLLRRTNPGQSKALDYEADALVKSAEIADKERRFSAMQSEVSSRSELGIGRSSRAFESALYGGSRYDSLPWNDLQRSFESSASDIERFMRERASAGMLSPAERMQMQNQIEDLRQKARVGVPRDQEQARNRTLIGEAALHGETLMAEGAHGFMFGSAAQQAGQFDVQLKNLQEREQVLRRILETSKYISYEEKIQLQTEIQQLKVSEEQAKKASAIAKAQAGRMERDTENLLGTYDSRTSLMRGAGGAQAGAAMSGLYQASLNDISSAERERSDLLSAGFDPKSPEVRQKDREIMNLKLSSEQSLRSLAVVPESGSDRAARSNLSTYESLYEAGFGGSPGAVRANLMQQMQLNQKRLNDLSGNRSKLIGEGKWTEAMEGDYAEAANSVRQSQIGLLSKYDQGWQENLISEAFNMPGQGRLAMTQFTRREASLRGIALRAFGGTEEQTREMRMFPTRFMQIAGMGSAQGFNAHALGSSGSNKIELEITLKDEKGVTLKKNTSQIDNFKSAMDLNFNRSAAETPSG